MAWREIGTPEERAVVEAVTGGYREHFQPVIGSEPKIATLTDGGKDILVARWTTPGGQSALPELTVWDTPENTYYIFRLPPGSWSSSTAIRSTFEKLLLPSIPDGKKPRATGVVLEIARNPLTGRWAGSGGLQIDYPPTQFDFGLMNWLDLWETPAASYVSAAFNKHDFAFRFPENMRWIAERFPPLESRVGQWGKKRILDELSPGGVAERDRDRVLARELVKRDLTGEELLAVLESRRGHEYGDVLEAVVEAGLAPRLAEAIRKYIREYPGGYPRGIGEPFGIVSRAEGVNFTDAALDVLRQHPGAYAAFRYAAAQGTTPADYRTLKELPCPDDYVPARLLALADMRKRLRLDEDGNPLPAK